MKTWTPEEMARRIDQTWLRWDQDLRRFEKFLQQSVRYPFASLVVPPFLVEHTRNFLAAVGAEITVGTVAGFPLGIQGTEVKCRELEAARGRGAREVDVVHNLCLLKSDPAAYRKEIRALRETAQETGLLIKVILEVGHLTLRETEMALDVLAEEGIPFAKTSTGFFQNWSWPKVRTMLQYRERLRIKVAGGIRDPYTAIRLLDMGVARLGTSAGVRLLAQV